MKKKESEVAEVKKILTSMTEKIKHLEEYKKSLDVENLSLIEKNKKLKDEGSALSNKNKEIAKKQKETISSFDARLLEAGGVLQSIKKETKDLQKDVAIVQAKKIKLEKSIAKKKSEATAEIKKSKEELSSILSTESDKIKELEEKKKVANSEKLQAVKEKNQAIEDSKIINKELIESKEKLTMNLDLLKKRQDKLKSVEKSIEEKESRIATIDEAITVKTEAIEKQNKQILTLEKSIESKEKQKKEDNEKAKYLAQWENELKLKGKAQASRNAHLNKMAADLDDAMKKV